VTDSYDFDGFSVLIASTGSTPNTRLYTGEELDPDLGLINLRARQYTPTTGRLLTIDPASGRFRQPITFNRYLYANGDPVNLVDPSGSIAALEAIGVLLIGNTVINATSIMMLARLAHLATGRLQVAAVRCEVWGLYATLDPFIPGAALALGGAVACGMGIDLEFMGSEHASKFLIACDVPKPPMP
jgi:RHS repeat-associated protein